MPQKFDLHICIYFFFFNLIHAQPAIITDSAVIKAEAESYLRLNSKVFPILRLIQEREVNLPSTAMLQRVAWHFHRKAETKITL